MAFRIGKKVEIASKEEGYVGSYYEAKIIEKLGDKYRVQYKTLVTDDYSRPLQEIIAQEEIRPAAYKIPISEYRIGEIVDAYDNEGWWLGTISGKINGKYVVYFHASTKDEYVYPKKRLRLHLEWINGNWTCRTT